MVGVVAELGRRHRSNHKVGRFGSPAPEYRKTVLRPAVMLKIYRVFFSLFLKIKFDIRVAVRSFRKFHPVKGCGNIPCVGSGNLVRLNRKASRAFRKAAGKISSNTFCAEPVLQPQDQRHYRINEGKKNENLLGIGWEDSGNFTGIRIPMILQKIIFNFTSTNQY